MRPRLETLKEDLRSRGEIRGIYLQVMRWFHHGHGEFCENQIDVCNLFVSLQHWDYRTSSTDSRRFWALSMMRLRRYLIIIMFVSVWGSLRSTLGEVVEIF